jgi:hypothetical protein
MLLSWMTVFAVPEILILQSMRRENLYPTWRMARFAGFGQIGVRHLQDSRQLS